MRASWAACLRAYFLSQYVVHLWDIPRVHIPTGIVRLCTSIVIVIDRLAMCYRSHCDTIATLRAEIGAGTTRSLIGIGAARYR